MTTRQPLDARKEALARAIGHLLAESVWADIAEATPQGINQGGDAAPTNSNARLAGKHMTSVAEERNERVPA